MRYVAWKGGEDESWQERPSITVFVEEEGARDTGLLDVNGVKLWRVPEKVPMGFVGRAG